MSTVWLYYETDGDSGYYHLQVFASEQKARAYQKSKNSAYGNVREVGVR